MTQFIEAFDGYLIGQRARKLSSAYQALLELTRHYWLTRHSNSALSDVTPDTIRRWLIWLSGKDETSTTPAPRNGRGLSGASVDIHYRNLKAFWLWCEREELLDYGRSPIRKVERPKFTEKLPDVLSEAEARAVLKRVRGDSDRHAFRDYCILLFFLDTGVRLNELAQLTVHDINLNQGYVKVLGKGDRERLVPLGLELRRALSRYLLKHRQAAEGEDALFVNGQGFRFEKEGVRTMTVRALRDYVPRRLSKIGPHTLRHTCATLDLLLNEDIDATRDMLGHRDVKTTQRYNHVAAIMRQNRQSPMDAALGRKEKSNGHHPD